MIKLVVTGLLFTLPLYAEPTGSVTDGPQSIRSFQPPSSTQDNVIKTYFDEAGPLAVEYYEHLTLLANPWMGGRQPDSEGSHIAGQYIVWNLEKFGLKPAFPAFEQDNSWYQPFNFQIDNGCTCTSRILSRYRRHGTHSR